MIQSRARYSPMSRTKNEAIQDKLTEKPKSPHSPKPHLLLVTDQTIQNSSVYMELEKQYNIVNKDRITYLNKCKQLEFEIQKSKKPPLNPSNNIPHRNIYCKNPANILSKKNQIQSKENIITSPQSDKNEQNMYNENSVEGQNIDIQENLETKLKNIEGLLILKTQQMQIMKEQHFISLDSLNSQISKLRVSLDASESSKKLEI